MKLLLFFLLLSIATIYAKVDPKELQALKDFYDTTNGDGWTKKDNWLQGDPCDNKWFGIKCDKGHVDAVDITQNNVTGHLPDNFGDLKWATQILLDCFNKIGGTIPESVGQMTKVFVWTMAGDPLTGTLPKGFCNMKSELMILHLGGSKLTGTIPDCLSFMKGRNCGLESIPWSCPVPDWAATGCHARCK